MVSEVSVELIGIKEIQEYLGNLPSRYFQEARKVYKSSSKRVQDDVVEKMRSGLTVKRRSGQLARSMKTIISGNTIKTLGATLFSDGNVAPYAPVHEFGTSQLGGPIRAKNAYRKLLGGPFLNIPSKFNKTPSGVQRRGAKQVFSDGAFIIPTPKAKKAKYAVIDKRTNQPMFWLVKEVSIPARLKFFQTADDEIPNFLSSLGRAIGRAIE